MQPPAQELGARDSMHIGILAAAAHAAANNSPFTIFYNPRYSCKMFKLSLLLCDEDNPTGFCDRL